MSNTVKIGLLAGVIVLSSIFSLTRFRGKPNVVKPRFEEVGRVVGEIAAKEINPDASVLLLGRGGERPMLAAQMKGFEEALGARIRAEVTTAFLPVPEMDTLDYMPEGVTDAEFAELLAPHGKPDLVVSFLGAPTFGRKTVSKWRSHKPTFMVVGAPKQSVQQGLDAGLIDIAMVFRGSAAGLAKKGATTEEWVEAYYEVLRGKRR